MDPPSTAEIGQRIAGTLERYPWLIAEDAEGVAGYAYATRHRERAAYQWSVEVSAYVRPGSQRRGIARRLYESLFAILAAQRFCNAYAGITIPNAPSVALHEALGFEHFTTFREIGYKLGEWHDVAWYLKQLRPRDPAPDPPIPFADFRKSTELASFLR